MKTNIYDNEDFFNSYSQMSRSKDGLAGAGEWHTLQKMLPDFKGKRVLDLGCGYGWHAKYAIDNGAKSVLAIDLSEKMLEVAREKNFDENITYEQADLREVKFSEDTFDIALSSLAFHYLSKDEMNALFAKLHSALVDEGEFVFSVEHPLFTSEGSQDWVYNEDGSISHFPIDNYFYEGERNSHFLGSDVKKYHKTLTTYIEVLLRNGFSIENIVEPMPDKQMLDIPGMKDELRRPMMMIISSKNHK
ncbi:SAM-dependent methyltransferase [Floricoccus tropicus]|uniref:SAM-dependent methyltransferase n=1 Tax=Floricoccus tropicus TaxID=1859473 RepID=A0A1E8GQ48_9LACT|nr:class I SAM-dependent methyltransferase [Floricoccus tropicus]OFI50347.1 SAM-dependent methyltransferase [Floricoccus tropicus]